ncbi:MAG: MBL fold metallo-hydrolase [Oscillospiraceae bacterium]|jgi:glyoxylase-like metal-dependent hydrolase (beta-lactamase superfamily II)|nr:MBL fold metallo-hydrolase [Oscillospiraceae bacterium]
MLNYTCIPVGMLQSNSYILKDAATGALALVDCGVFNKPVREELAAQGGDLRYILLTHGHFDHIQGVARAKEAYPAASVCVSAEDAPYVRGEQSTIPHRPMHHKSVRQPDLLLAEGSVLALGESALRVIFTPGHTLGGVCFYCEADGLLFTGDTLFFEEVGRDDLPGGDWPTLRASILRLYDLPGETAVLPGHGQASTIAHERKNNLYVKQ